MAENKIRRALFAGLEKDVTEGKLIWKSKELYELGFSTRMLHAFVKEEILFRIREGIYCLSEKKPSEEDLICQLFPDGILTLESALYEYGYLSQRPLTWHIVVDRDTSKARFKMEYPMVKPYYAEQKVMSYGVTQIKLSQSKMSIYDKDRLMVECIRHENHLSHEHFKKALRAYLQDEEKNIPHLIQYAKERNVMTKLQGMIGVWL